MTTHTADEKTIGVSFPYDPEKIARIKVTPFARWDATNRVWRIPQRERRWVEQWMTPPPRHTDHLPAWQVPTPPWAHQTRALHYAAHRPAVLLDVGLGAGKSLMTLAILAAREHHRTLIVCPKAVVPVWEQQIARHAPGRYGVVLLDTGSVKKNRTCAEDALSTGVPVILLINYESVWRQPFGEWALDQPWDCLVCDEAHHLQSAGSRQSRFLYRLGFRATQKLALSGTPFGQDPLNAYGLYRFLDPTIFGTNFAKFRDEYAVVDTSPGFPKIIGYRNQPQLRAQIDRLRFHTPRDVLDLPSVQHIDIPVPLPAECAVTYRRLERDFYTRVGTGEVTASNVLVKALRLAQVTSGFATLDPTDTEVKGRTLTLHSAKYDALCNLLRSTDPTESFVVFARFTYDLRQIAHAATASGRSYWEMSGRAKELPGWLLATGGVLGVQMQTGAEGQNDMVKAHYGVFYSVPFGLQLFDQACGRLHRPGQTQPVTYYHLVMPDTIDQKVYAALQARRDVIKALLDDR